MRLVGISGSLREISYNTALLREAAEMLPSGVELEIVRIDELPLYNSDLGEVAPVARLREQIGGADGVIIATPEYNYGIPGPLKNAIDWASRPAYRSPFAGKPVGILGATNSFVGTARAQGQLKQVLLGMLSLVFPWPEFVMGGATARIVDGKLVDEPTRELLAKFLAGFVAFVEKQNSG